MMKEVVYEYKGKKYRIFAESKSKINGEWVDSIIYQSLYHNEDGWIWVRTNDEFFELFKEFQEPEELEEPKEDSINEEIKELREELYYAKNRIKESDIFHGKLSYVLKIFLANEGLTNEGLTNEGLTNEEKLIMVEKFDKAEDLTSAKKIYDEYVKGIFNETYFIGRTIEAARIVCKSKNLIFRIIREDGVFRIVIRDYDKERINFVVEKGRITDATRG